MKRPAPVPGHEGFGYCGEGVYRCFCQNWEVQSLRTEPMPADAEAAITSLKDQWQAHLAEVMQNA